ncbi:MAG: NAD(P)/FAD-dependent oxidoreductase [Gammaproteobacteria bacterium]
MNPDVIIIGAGAAGLMCAIEAGKRGRRVLVLDHANKIGKKILMSGGGRCNFTNLDIHPDRYISHNPHFCKSALSRYTQWDFIELVKKHRIPFHEKTLGQLFCDDSAKDIVNMLLSEANEARVTIQPHTSIDKVIQQLDKTFTVETSKGHYHCESLVIATGGLSIPTMGATPFGYKIAEQFGMHVWPTRAGLVPVTLHVHDKERLAPLSGISTEARVFNERISFREDILLTHRGLSGPSILQISSYWEPGEEIRIQLLPDIDLADLFITAKKNHPKRSLMHVLSEHLPKRLLEVFVDEATLTTTMATFTDAALEKLALLFQDWTIKPNATEGYRTAEVTLGGIDCDAISSKTMEAQDVPGLYFIGEVLDVSGWLGGYNFQWAWSSGWAAGQVV